MELQLETLKAHLQQRIVICEKERKTALSPYTNDLKDIQDKMAKIKREDQIRLKTKLVFNLKQFGYRGSYGHYQRKFTETSDSLKNHIKEH